jgi:hypothetical protein
VAQHDDIGHDDRKRRGIARLCCYAARHSDRRPSFGLVATVDDPCSPASAGRLGPGCLIESPFPDSRADLAGRADLRSRMTAELFALWFMVEAGGRRLKLREGRSPGTLGPFADATFVPA